MEEVLGVPVKYLEHYSIFCASKKAEEDVFVHPENDEFTFLDGEVFSCKLLDQALFEYHAILGREWLDMQAKYNAFGDLIKPIK